MAARGLVAVTGATGFIGGRIVRRLRCDGWRVRFLLRCRPTGPGPADPAVEAVEGSLDDGPSLRRLVRGAAAVVHAAGLVKARSRAEFFKVNADGVARLVEAVIEQPAPPHVVLVSSLAAREPHLSAYAASKRAGEAALIGGGGGDGGDAVPWTILRPPAVYGPGDRQTLMFFRMVKLGFGPVPGGAEAARVSLLHVDDLAAAVAAVVDEGAGAFGLVAEPDDGQPGGHSWPSLVAAAAERLGTPVRILRVPRWLTYGYSLASGALRLVPGHVPALTPDKVRELYHGDWVCDATSMMDATKWRPRTPLGPGFAETIAWYRLHRWL
jgi:nucleoside-diphosphate-sugar epimerase